MNFETFISEYLLILITMATILFITNEMIKLHDSIRILYVTWKVRKIVSHRPPRDSVGSTPNHTTLKGQEPQEKPVWKVKPRQTTEEWNPPQFQLKWGWYGLGAIGVILVLVVGYGLLTYDPNGGR